MAVGAAAGNGSEAAGAGCAACGRRLFGAVAFCPFCGRRQATAVEPEAVRRAVPDAERAADPVREAVAPPQPVVPPPPQPSRPVPQPVPPQQPVPAARASVPPTAAPASQPPPPVAGVLTGRWGPRPSIWRRKRTAAPPPPPRTRRRRRGGLRQLLVLLLLCWVLWRLFSGLPAGGTGTVTVLLPREVSGTVLVDGEPHGRAGEAIRLPAGRHSIGLAAAGWDAAARTVAVERDRTMRVVLEPRALPVAVSVSAVPAAAALSVDGRDAGGTPTTLSLAPGMHRLRVTAEGYVPESRLVRVRPGEARTVSFTLRGAAARRITLTAAVGAWSDPVPVASGDRLGFVFAGRLRLRLGGRVLLVEPGQGVDLGTVDPGSLQVEAAQDTPFSVEVLVSHDGDGGAAAADAER